MVEWILPKQFIPDSVDPNNGHLESVSTSVSTMATSLSANTVENPQNTVENPQNTVENPQLVVFGPLTEGWAITYQPT